MGSKHKHQPGEETPDALQRAGADAGPGKTEQESLTDSTEDTALRGNDRGEPTEQTMRDYQEAMQRLNEDPGLKSDLIAMLRRKAAKGQHITQDSVSQWLRDRVNGATGDNFKANHNHTAAIVRECVRVAPEVAGCFSRGRRCRFDPLFPGVKLGGGAHADAD